MADDPKPVTPEEEVAQREVTRWRTMAHATTVRCERLVEELRLANAQIASLKLALELEKERSSPKEPA